MMTDASSFGRRTAALLAAHSEHLPRVLDLTVLGERRELELAPVSGPTLAAVLARRRRLPTGEAVTVVVCVARAVAALHAAGYCGARLEEDAIGFDGAGTPVVLGVDSPQEILLTGVRGPADDWRALAALADRLGLVAHGRIAGALGPAQHGLGLAFATLTAGESERSIDRLEAALFELAAPEPVRLDGALVAPQAIGPERGETRLEEGRRGAAHRRPSGSMLIEALDAGPAALLATPLAEARSRATALLGRLQGRARLLVVGGAAAALLTVVALVLMPSKTDSTGAHAPSSTPSARPSAASAPATAATGSTGTAGAAIAGDDPVTAAAELLATRDGCLAGGAAARASCLSAIADGQASDLTRPARPLAGLEPSLLERRGDSALIALTPTDAETAPASALLMRTEAGWRLRQLYEN